MSMQKQQPNSNRSPARVYDRRDRTKRFGVVWSEAGKRRFQFFESKKKRDAFLRDFNARVQKVGSALLELSAADAAIMAECVRKLGSAAHVLRAVDEYKQRNALNTVPLAGAMQEFLDEKYNQGVDEDYLRHVTKTLGRFPSAGSAAEISPDTARRWAAGLPLAPVTVCGQIKTMVSFCNWLVARGYARENPFRTVPLPAVPEKEPEFLQVGQAQALMTAAKEHHPDAVAYFALGLFAGLRSSACTRIGMEYIRFDQRGILITGEHAKNKRRQFVDGHEPNLWNWLDWCREHAPEGFDLNARLWERRRKQVALRAGVKLPHNALRHSFCTYHCALHGDAGKTATLLTHRGNVSILYQHYKGNASKADAVKFFGIAP